MNAQDQVETLKFEAEVNQLLHLVTHSLYKNGEDIFLRELISNAADAADKLRYDALGDSALYEQDPELAIWVEYNKDQRTITVRDNGIGMSREEVISNLGTIAKSGTKAFKELLKGDQSKDSKLIGQFGVGFYSAFIVADKVVVRTRRAGTQKNQGVYWESDGVNEFSIKNIDREQRGTEIILYLKKDMDDLLNDYRLRQIITQYSDCIPLPIKMTKPLTPEDEKKAEKGEVIIPELETVNRAKALWAMPKNEIKDEDYQELYKHIAHDFENPLVWAHNKVEGKLEYICLLYIPARAPFDLWNRDVQRGLKLYVRNVFIMDDAEQLMPMYLRFIKGVVDSSDLPLNISREVLQNNKTIDKIKAGCVKRVLSTLEKMAENDSDTYQKFWQAFGQVIKEGPAEDFANRERIAKLIRFTSTHVDSEQQTVSLADYVSRMKDGQEKIYYIISDTFTAAKNSPLLEVFRKKGIEVLLLSDRVDEWLVAHLNEFEGKSLQSIAKGNLDIDKLGDTDNDSSEEQTAEADKKQQEKDYQDLLAQFKEALGDRVKEVRLSERLVDSPTCVVFDENEMSGHMQRLMAAAGQQVNDSKPILEINPQHPLVVRVKQESQKERIQRWSDILLSQALLAEGEQLKDPAAFVKGLNELLLETTQV